VDGHSERAENEPIPECLSNHRRSFFGRGLVLAHSGSAACRAGRPLTVQADFCSGATRHLCYVGARVSGSPGSCVGRGRRLGTGVLLAVSRVLPPDEPRAILGPPPLQVFP